MVFPVIYQSEQFLVEELPEIETSSFSTLHSSVPGQGVRVAAKCGLFIEVVLSWASPVFFFCPQHKPFERELIYYSLGFLYCECGYKSSYNPVPKVKKRLGATAFTFSWSEEFHDFFEPIFSSLTNPFESEMLVSELGEVLLRRKGKLESARLLKDVFSYHRTQ